MATPTNLPASAVAGQVLTAQYVNDLAGAFRILQVVNAHVTVRTFSTSSASYTDVTGLSLSITPQSSTSKILLFSNVGIGSSENSTVVNYFQFVRNSTAVGSGGEANFVINTTSNALTFSGLGFFIDSPSLTSAITYKLQMKVTGGTTFLNRRGASDLYQVASNLLAMEISA
jgi:hypothetical protein